MDFAVYIGEEKILIYKKDSGIVLNEPALFAYKNNKLIAVGKSALQFEGDADATISPVVRHGILQNVGDTSAFIQHMVEKVGKISRCIVCISSSISANELYDYKSSIYSAGIVDAVFIPKVIASAVDCGQSLASGENVLSMVKDGNFVDMAIINGCEIVSGGTLDDLGKLEEAKKRLISGCPKIKQTVGDHINVINGAGRLLSNNMLRNIVKSN